MDKLVRKIEIPLAKKAIEKAGLYIVQKKISTVWPRWQPMPIKTIPYIIGLLRVSMIPRHLS